jgi:hypothetical protein
MSQIFHHSTNSLARITLFGAIFFVAFAGWAFFELGKSAYVTRAYEAREQPVPFSHAHHVGGMGLDCRYCHTTVETSGFANIPPTKTCMNCHSQIWNQSPTLEPVRSAYKNNQSIRWVRVHDLPDFVYFDHSIHVNKGVGCESRHGRIDKMGLTSQQSTLQMQWCLDCHRAPEQHLRPRDQVFAMGYKPAGSQTEIGLKLKAEYNVLDARTLTSCSTCHR